MPASSPPVSPSAQDILVRLGSRLRAARKQQGVSSVSAAEAAGISRMTLHRIERGEPTVAIGAWAAAAGALGLFLDVQGATARPASEPLPARIRLDEYPELKKLAWQLQGVEEVTPREALELYERNWRHVDVASLSAKERDLVEQLARLLGAGRLLV